MKNPIFVPELRDLLKRKKYDIIKSFLEVNHPKEIAEYLALLNPDEIWKILDLVDIYTQVDIFKYFEMDVQIDLVSGSMRSHITELLKELSPDSRADLFLNLEKDMADRLLLLLPINERADVLNLTSYNEKSAGSIMTTDHAILHENDKIESAIRKLRKEAPSRETIYYIYVIDDDGRLIGFVTLEKLILAKPRQRIRDIMKSEIIYASTEDDQEHAAKLIDEYDLLALPIVDNQERLMGIVTYDDAIDIIHEEHTEDMERLMAISGEVADKPYLDVPAFVHFKKRAFWVIILALIGLVTALIVRSYQKVLEALIVLAFYMPMLNATGGNTGSQSASVILRALALNELTPSDVWKVVKKELQISAMLSLCLGAIVFVRVLFFSSSDVPADISIMNVALVIAISLTLQVVWSTTLGAVVPLLASRLKVDPALVSSPLLSTLVDMGGIFIYFSVAKAILNI